MVLSTGVTATTWMLTVLSDTTMSHGDVAALFACFMIAGRHIGRKENSEEDDCNW